MNKYQYSLAFRGEHVYTFGSVYPEVHVVLTYPSTRSNAPRLVSWYKTARAAQQRITDDPTHLDQWRGQSFVVKAHPGVSEIVDMEVVK